MIGTIITKGTRCLSPEEKVALVDLINAVHNLPPVWNPNNVDSGCGWTGITCNDQGNIIDLTLIKRGLSGSLSNSLSNMSALQTLDFSTNSLDGTIPTWKLLSTKTLNLAQNLLTGTLPPSLGCCTRLEYLSVADNRLTGTVPSALTNITSLKNLYLSHNSFTGCLPSVALGIQNCDVTGNVFYCCGHKLPIQCVGDPCVSPPPPAPNGFPLAGKILIPLTLIAVALVVLFFIIYKYCIVSMRSVYKLVREQDNL